MVIQVKKQHGTNMIVDNENIELCVFFWMGVSEMKIDKIIESFTKHGWTVKKSFGDGVEYLFRKGKYGAMYCFDNTNGKIVLGMARFEDDPIKGDIRFYTDGSWVCLIGDVFSIVFPADLVIDFRLYNGTSLLFNLDYESTPLHAIFQERRNHYPAVERPAEEDEDDRPYLFTVELQQIEKTYIEVYACNEKEAIALVENMDDDYYERNVEPRLDFYDFKYRVVYEDRTKRLDESEINEVVSSVRKRSPRFWTGSIQENNSCNDDDEYEGTWDNIIKSFED